MDCFLQQSRVPPPPYKLDSVGLVISLLTGLLFSSSFGMKKAVGSELERPSHIFLKERV